MASIKRECTESEIDDTNQESDDGLMSMENIDRDSPELWPEKSMNEFMNTYNFSNNKLPYSKEFTAEDTSFMNNLSLLSTAGLISKVKELHDIAYQLGKEESKEMTRGKCLKIFDKPKRTA